MEDQKPKIAGLRSIKLDMEPGTYFWCSCGRSNAQPFCDESHVGTSFEPLEVIISEKGRYKWCSCKHTKTPPFCDDSHRELEGYVPKEK
jgi:CDGSH iron-sulfur domain-containing protein 3